MFVVTVRFVVARPHITAFRQAMIDQARVSLASEPGCHQFDVCQTKGLGDQMFLYEIYTDNAAFDAHLASGHFRNFDETVRPWVIEKHVEIHERITP